MTRFFRIINIKSGGLIFSAFYYFTISLQAQAIDCSDLLKNCNVQGSITIYDLNNKKWMYSDEADAKVETLPASTFKIFNSLVGLEEKAVKDENEILKWDSVNRGNKNWNADTDMKDAFKNSTVWYYQEIARRVGAKKYQSYLKRSNLGNKTMGDVVDMFWLDGSLTISPVQQINFLVDLYKDKLPFSKTTMATVKEIMVAEKTETYTLRAKTGWGFKDSTDIGWWVGYFETKTNVYFFATRLTLASSIQNENFGGCRKTITYEVMKKLKLID